VTSEGNARVLTWRSDPSLCVYMHITSILRYDNRSNFYMCDTEKIYILLRPHARKHVVRFGEILQVQKVGSRSRTFGLEFEHRIRFPHCALGETRCNS
jgi:hypothetical protein